MKLTIYDVSGRKVRDLLNEILPVGVGDATWDGRDNTGAVVPSGVYLAKMVVGGYESTKKIVLAK